VKFVTHRWRASLELAFNANYFQSSYRKSLFTRDGRAKKTTAPQNKHVSFIQGLSTLWTTLCLTTWQCARSTSRRRAGEAQYYSPLFSLSLCRCLSA